MIPTMPEGQNMRKALPVIAMVMGTARPVEAADAADVIAVAHH
jgi:hypothetical protein